MLGECADETPAGETGNHSWFVRLSIEGLDEYHAEISARGAEVITEPADKKWELREFVVRTPKVIALCLPNRFDHLARIVTPVTMRSEDLFRVHV